MKAIFAEQPFQIGIREIPRPEIGEDEVLIRTAYCGICGSDIHAYRGRHAFRIPPVMLGHEIAGTVAAAGRAVEGVAVGENVTVMPQIGCGDCVYCRAGATNLCQGKIVPGTPQWNGTFGEYFSAPARAVVPLGEVSCRHGALAEPLSVANHVLSRNRGERFSDDLIIWGAGTIGLLILMLAPFYGYRRILVTDVQDHNLQLALELGAARAVNVLREDAQEAALQFFGVNGAGTTILAAGGTDVFDRAIRVTAPGGAILYFTMITQPATILTHPIVAKELRILGSVNYDLGDFRDSVALLSQGRLPVDRIITHEFPLERAAEAFQMLDQRTGNAIKALIHF